jgi:hypothetical protein
MGTSSFSFGVGDILTEKVWQDKQSGYLFQHSDEGYGLLSFYKPTGCSVTARRFIVLLLLLFFLDLNDLSAFVEATTRTDDVRNNHGPAIGASHQISSFQRVVSTPTIAAALREFTLWLRGHIFLLPGVR